MALKQIIIPIKPGERARRREAGDPLPSTHRAIYVHAPSRIELKAMEAKAKEASECTDRE